MSPRARPVVSVVPDAVAHGAGLVVDAAGALPRIASSLGRQARARAGAASWLDRQQLAGFATTLRGGGELVLDESLMLLIKAGVWPHSETDLERITGELDVALAAYERHGWDRHPLRFHRPPPPPGGATVRHQHIGPLRYEHLSFDSGYEPHPDLPGGDRWTALEENRTVHAWVLRHDEPRPWLLCLHGALMGSARTDMVGFRARWLHEDLGLNLAMLVLPRHGPRRRGLPLPLVFPGDDPIDNLHGFAQSVWDARRLVAWMRDHGADQVGVYGISLGGCVAALLAGIEPGLDAVIAGMPPADVVAMFDRHMPWRLRGRAEYASFVAHAEQVHRVVSPLSFPALVPRRARFVYAGTSDHVVDPLQQARTLWVHWDRPRIQWFPGSHVGYLWSGAVEAFVREALVETGLVPEHDGGPAEGPGDPPARGVATGELPCSA